MDNRELSKLADEHGYSDKMGNVSGLFEHFELGYNVAQAEIARLKELLNEARNVIRMKNEKIEDLSSQVKSILARANGVANKNIQLQSALDVAVEALSSTWPNMFPEIRQHHKEALDKIKQIKNSTP